jgi:hypothetical protein
MPFDTQTTNYQRIVTKWSAGLNSCSTGDGIGGITDTSKTFSTGEFDRLFRVASD